MVIAQAKQGDLTATIYVGDDEAYYARWIEFGTQKMAAQPFFFVAYRALRKRSKSRIKRSQRKAAKKVAAS
jgi:HK97 gp10 family phage protein